MRLRTREPVPRRRDDARGDPRPARRAAARLAPALIALAACGDPQPAEDFWKDLTEKGACGDLYFYAHDPDDTILLEVTSAEPQIQGDDERTITWTLPVEGIEITVKTGEGVSAASCTDTVNAGGPTFDQTWTAVEGRAEVVLTPDAALNWTATLELEGVHLEGALHPLDIPRFTIADQPVGEDAG